MCIKSVFSVKSTIEEAIKDIKLQLKAIDPRVIIFPTFRSIFSKINIFPDSVFKTNQINLDFYGTG